MDTRPLVYPLKNAALPETTVSDDTPSEMTWSASDPDERIFIALFLSLNEYVALASIIDVGRDIAYPEDSFGKWWLWESIYKVSNFCAAVINCIETSEGLRTALDALIAELMLDTTSNTYNAVSSLAQQAARDAYGENLSNARMAEDLVGGTNPTCDYDILYGQCLSICKTVNRAIVDGLEKVETASNAGEIGRAIADLPLLNLITRNTGITSALEAVDKAIEFLSEGYLAAYDEAKEVQYACALFCACKEDCQITIERCYDVFYEIVSEHGTFPLFGNLGDWISWFNAVVVTGGVVADVAFYAAFGALKVGNFLFFGAADWLLDVQIQRAANNPDGDWIFCDCPTFWEYTIDLTDGLGDWSVGAGTWIDGVGIVNDTGSEFPYTAQANINVADWAGATLTDWSVNANSTTADSGAFRGAIFVVGGVPTLQDLGGGETGDYTLLDTASEATPDLIAIQISNATIPGTNTIKSITLSGTGSMPTFS